MTLGWLLLVGGLGWLLTGGPVCRPCVPKLLRDLISLAEAGAALGHLAEQVLIGIANVFIELNFKQFIQSHWFGRVTDRGASQVRFNGEYQASCKRFFIVSTRRIFPASERKLIHVWRKPDAFPPQTIFLATQPG
ncbi:hypothetical protein BX070DRAFT_61873 [Coemansia spiralis]|nr:hypothetical protein BX070DRAFT_61873 [Coemansia spiralis]